MAHIWTSAKGIWQYIGWEGVMAFFGFGTLGTALSKSYSLWFAIIIAIIGFALVILAARNSYKHKSVALVDEYERRFFERMKKERKLASQYLLNVLDGKLDKNDAGSIDLDSILDFFQAPIADKVNSGFIDEEQIYEYFYVWIFMYIQASFEYIEDYQKYDLSSWAGLKPLYNRMLKIKRKKEKALSGNENWIYTEEMLRKALFRESQLSCD